MGTTVLCMTVNTDAVENDVRSTMVEFGIEDYNMSWNDDELELSINLNRVTDVVKNRAVDKVCETISYSDAELKVIFTV